MVNDNNATVGSAVKQRMRQAKAQGSGYLVDGATSLTESGTDGAVKFSDNGAFTTGKLYVVVNYFPTGNGTYAQTSNESDIKDGGSFVEERKFDVNGKLNRITFTQQKLDN